jgi:YD repeat-containing protein
VNQTKTWTFRDANQESYDYDANGRLTKITKRGGQETRFSYDDADRISGKAMLIQEAMIGLMYL